MEFRFIQFFSDIFYKTGAQKKYFIVVGCLNLIIWKGSRGAEFHDKIVCLNYCVSKVILYALNSLHLHQKNTSNGI